MTPEEKLILLNDLLSRTLYMPIVNIKGHDRQLISLERTNPNQELTAVVNPDVDGECRHHNYPLDEIKPYLRPMSSMSKEEADEWNKLCEYCFEQDVITYNQLILENWKIEHYFDSRGLIERGLALPAKEGMYNFKKQ